MSIKNKLIDKILQNLTLGDDGIYGGLVDSKEQVEEIELREKVANEVGCDYMNAISRSHSIPVMDYEVQRMLNELPKNAVLIDVGGCWGWHWRNLKNKRPDVKVLIVDFVRANLLHAKVILGQSINKSVFLLHGDATNLEIPDLSVDCYWSVQALQHIPNYNKAINEAFRVLKDKGQFINYSLNDQFPIRKLYNLFGKSYVVKGEMSGSFYIERASVAQKSYIEEIFSTTVIERWSEILYKPELHVILAGKKSSWLGFIDSKLSNCMGILGSIARQKSYHCVKHRNKELVGQK